MKKLFLAILFLIFWQNNFAQRSIEIAGKISYITSQNIYVRLENSVKVSKGDTIYINIKSTYSPIFIVESSSSLSCMGKPLMQNGFAIDMLVYNYSINKSAEENKPTENVDAIPLPGTEIKEVKPIKESTISKDEFQQKINGRLSVTSYSNFSKETKNNLRMRYTASLNAQNISDSRFSFESYISFTHRKDEWYVVKNNINDALKIYNLALKYQIGSQTIVWVGRKINPRLSNIGALDGIQYESGGNKLRYGVAGGFRPDYKDYSLNKSLFQYGAYLSYDIKNKNGYMQNTLSFMEQRNNGEIDRRLLYFQHSNSLVKNVYLLLSSEMDLYQLDNGQPANNLRLTSLYLAIRYQIIKQLAIHASYDARKNVIYYETFKNLIDQLLDEATRQGLNLRLTYRPVKRMNIGLSGSYRVRDNDERPAKTFNSYVTYTQVPGINVSVTLLSNILQNSYTNGWVLGTLINKDLLNNKIYITIGYRYVKYDFYNSQISTSQNIGELDITWRIFKKISISANYEGTLEKDAIYHRIFVNLVKRF